MSHSRKRHLSIIGLFALLPAVAATWVVAKNTWTVPGRDVREHQYAPELDITIELPEPGQKDWPWWRGTSGNGTAPAQLESCNRSVAEWDVDIPGMGQSSPIVRGDRVFVTTFDAPSTVSLICLHRDNGRMIWRTDIARNANTGTNDSNSPASPTPACDGSRVFVPVIAGDRAILSAVSIDGKTEWQKDVGCYQSVQGFASSPAICGNNVILCCDSKGPGNNRHARVSFLVALNRESGRVAWRTSRDSLSSFSTPIIAQTGTGKVMILPGKRSIMAYDPITGRELWNKEWEAARPIASAAVAHGAAVVCTKKPGNVVMCLDFSQSDEISRASARWKLNRCSGDIPSPLIHDEYVLTLDDAGILNCLEFATGDVLWRERLGGQFAASPILAAGSIWLVSKSGRLLQLRSGNECHLVQEQTISTSESFWASPAVSGDLLILRSTTRVYCRRMIAG